MAVLFPDVEIALITYLKSVLPNGVLVATKKPAADATQPVKQVIISAAYNGERDFVAKVVSLTVDVYADTYANANSLGLLVESKIRGCVGDPIKKATVLLGPVRTAEPSEMEKRSLDIELIVKGSNS